MKSTEQTQKFRAMNESDQKKELAKLEKELVLLSLNVSVGKVQNYSNIGRLRKSVARLQTIITEKEATPNE